MPQPKGRSTIGRVTKIDFPKLGITDVLAKVDTGADSSSVWASNIKERAGKLSFTLFAQGSPYYTGGVITTRHYHIRSIKNSFGQAEFRYKVSLQVTLENRTVNVSFTLANRSDNRFPVLIGRRTLHGRFLIDVSIDDKAKYEILVIRSGDTGSTKVSGSFFKHLKQENKKLSFNFVNLSDLEFLLGGTEPRVQISRTKQDIADFDLVYFRVFLANFEIGAAAAQYLQSKNVPFMDRSLLLHHQSVNKLHQLLCLQSMGVKVPESIFVMPTSLPGSYQRAVKQLGSPFVLKDIRGKRGRNLFLISNKAEFDKVCKRTKEQNLDMIAQRFIPHEGHYRLIVLGKRIELVIFMTHKLSSPRMNKKVTKGRSVLGDELVLPGAIRQMAITAASVSQVEIAGVDILQDKETGLWYCLEVNENPQLVTGSFVKQKEEILAKYLMKKLGQ
ncbi:MAG: RimK/LysX family protein [Patescibacteria group bacterium]